MAAPAERNTIVEAPDEEIDALVAEFGGDPREAIRALLHDLTELAMIPRQPYRAAMSAAKLCHFDCRRRRM